MAINYNEEEFGLQIPNEGGITDVAFAPGSALDRQINKLNTLEQMGYPQQNLQNLKDMDMKQFKETGTPLSLPADQYAMAISNYDQLFGPKTMTDAFGTIRNVQGLNRPDLYTGMMDQSGNPIRDDIDMQYTDESFNVQPQYTFRDQIADDFGKIKNKIGSGLGSLKDFAVGKGKKGWNLGKMAMSGIGNAIMPGLGFLMSNLKPEPLYRETLANSRMANPLATRGFETIDGTRTSIDGVSDFGGFTTDDLGRITQTGDYITPENIMSGYNAGFDLAGSALDRIGNIQDLMAKDPKSKWHQQRMKKIDALKTAAVASAQAKRQAYQDKIDRAKDAAAAQKARAKSITAGYGGHDHSPGATGPTAAGAGMGVGGGYASDYGFLKDGGRVGYANGGLASLFTRRG